MLSRSETMPFDIQIHKIRSKVILRYLFLTVAGILEFVFSLLFGVLRWQYALRNFGPASLVRWITPIGGFLLLSLIITIASLVMLLRTRKIELQLSPAGFSLQKGKSIEMVEWSKVNYLQTVFVSYGIMGITWGARTELQVLTDDNQRFRFNRHYEEIDSLVDTTKRYVYPILLQKYRQSFNGGEPLAFGPLILTSEGVLNGRKALRWKEIDKIQLKEGMLQVHPHENLDRPKLSIPARKIPNVDLCLQLISHFGAQA